MTLKSRPEVDQPLICVCVGKEKFAKRFAKEKSFFLELFFFNFLIVKLTEKVRKRQIDKLGIIVFPVSAQGNSLAQQLTKRGWIHGQYTAHTQRFGSTDRQRKSISLISFQKACQKCLKSIYITKTGQREAENVSSWSLLSFPTRLNSV